MIAVHMAGGRTLHLADPATVSAFMARQCDGGADYRNPLWRAALAGDLDVIELMSGGRIAPATLAIMRRPTVIVVGDDAAPAAPSPGPGGFAQAERLARWAACAIVHAAVGDAPHYSLAATWAREHRRVLFVETGSRREAAWVDLLDAEAKRRFLTGLPPMLGARVTCRVGVHPLPEFAA